MTEDDYTHLARYEYLGIIHSGHLGLSHEGGKEFKEKPGNPSWLQWVDKRQIIKSTYRQLRLNPISQLTLLVSWVKHT